MHLAIFKVNHLGDNVVFLPVVQALRRRRPAWRLTLITAPHVAALYSADVARDDLLTVSPEGLKTAWHRPWELAAWTARLVARRVDASLVSYDQNSVAHGLAWLTSGRPRVGAAGLRIRLAGTLTHEVARQPEWSMARWNWETARTLVTAIDGGQDWPTEPPRPDLTHLIAGTTRHPNRIVIHAGSKWEYTRWPLDRHAELAGRLAGQHEVIWVNAPETRCALPAGVQARDCSGLAELTQLLASATLFIGNNSGPMHLANAVGTPGVIVSGPSDPAWDPSWDRDRYQVLRAPGLACLPCDRGHFAAFRCTNDQEPLACMRRWPVDELEHRCRAWLARWSAHA